MRLNRLFVVIAAFGLAIVAGCSCEDNPACICEDTQQAIITTFADETGFTTQLSPEGPLDAPISSGETDSVYVGDGLIIITPGWGVASIAVGNIVGNSLPTDLIVSGGAYSNFCFSFEAPVSGFGFGVSSWTASGDGTSDFMVIIYYESVAIGSTMFSAPSSGEIFFAMLSTEEFEALTIMETSGGPQNDTSGGVDREFFGKFYVVP